MRINLNKENIHNADVVVIVTNHTDIDYKLISDNSKNIVDSRGVFRL